MGMEEHAALDSLVRRSAEPTRSAALLAAVSAAEVGGSGGAAAVVARLCARGTRLQKDQRDASGNTALMLAVRYNNLEIARLLLLLRPDLCSLHARNKVTWLGHAPPQSLFSIREAMTSAGRRAGFRAPFVGEFTL
ncbi:hypothetical protein EGR_02844 [Echinococcus granulosus]|uniref:Uncharacterized protein n=1 Tax=Echinococcus granulosus TaxID=6210 RepID=W6UMN4_ECHGR|nr:hypothetical protein EGR_02844 [Echinococcus granulosus]EUB62391.1 hypothetical protein EGR_02844 [Echinococcus granulosus]